MKTAKYWHRLENGKINCDLCPHQCLLSEEKTGLCRVRTVHGGELQAYGYGLISSAAVDPVEKKPLYHFHPGSGIFSVGGWGCNFACEFCQNWKISQVFEPELPCYTPEQVVRKAGESGSIGIAYTYNEPLVGIEFIEDCARLARERGLVNVLVTNGSVNPAAAADLLPFIDALNVDIKSMDDAFYRKRCHGSLEPVKAFALQAVKAGCHIEITNLLIPTLNDELGLIKDLALWVRETLGPGVPLHLSAYHPEHQCEIPGTPAGLVEDAYEICNDELMYVYTGNVWTEKGRDTLCPGCGCVQVSRQGYNARVQHLSKGHCTKCDRPSDLVL